MAACVSLWHYIILNCSVFSLLCTSLIWLCIVYAYFMKFNGFSFLCICKLFINIKNIWLMQKYFPLLGMQWCRYYIFFTRLYLQALLTTHYQRHASRTSQIDLCHSQSNHKHSGHEWLVIMLWKEIALLT